MNVLVRASGLAAGYGRRRVIEDVSLEIGAGDLWFLVGPNGHGKTTLVRALLGEIEPLAGSVELDPSLRSRERLGFVPQRCDWSPHVPATLREFVTLGTVGIRCGREERRLRTAEALAHVGLGGLGGTQYWALSGGQRQRALVARALARQPALLVLDEPTAGLDFPSAQGLIGLLLRLHSERRITVLFVTHDIGLAARYAGFVAVCGQGRIRSGPRASMLTADVLGEAYGLPLRVDAAAAAGGVFQVEVAADSPKT